jgi:hypothetical protein
MHLDNSSVWVVHPATEGELTFTSRSWTTQVRRQAFVCSLRSREPSTIHRSWVDPRQPRHPVETPMPHTEPPSPLSGKTKDMYLHNSLLDPTANSLANGSCHQRDKFWRSRCLLYSCITHRLSKVSATPVSIKYNGTYSKYHLPAAAPETNGAGGGQPPVDTDRPPELRNLLPG